MRGYYIMIASHSSHERMNSGVFNKVQAQVKVLNEAGIETELLTLVTNTTTFLGKVKKGISPSFFLKNIPSDFFASDFWYFRYSIPSVIPLLGLIKKIRQQGKGKIIIEIPTYPYKQELKSVAHKFALAVDSIFNRQFKK